VIASGKPGEMTGELIADFHELVKSDGPLIYPEAAASKK
jgi:hypothetical protein